MNDNVEIRGIFKVPDFCPNRENEENCSETEAMFWPSSVITCAKGEPERLSFMA